MKFSEEVKGEILSVKGMDKPCKRAMLSAFLRTAGTICSLHGNIGFEYSTESEKCADCFNTFLKDLYGVCIEPTAENKKSSNGRKSYKYISSDSVNILTDLGIIAVEDDGIAVKLNIDFDILERDEEKTAYIRGAFLGSGSVTLPKIDGSSSTGYHLEFVFTNYQTATDFCEVLSEVYFLPKLIERKGDYIVYLKTRDEISDLLALMGAQISVLKLVEVTVEKDMKNNYNRQLNCEMSNMTKQIDASVKQICAINKLSETIGLSALPKGLIEVAQTRLQYKNDTLSQLAERLKITKSCLNHRLRKIVELADSL